MNIVYINPISHLKLVIKSLITTLFIASISFNSFAARPGSPPGLDSGPPPGLEHAPPCTEEFDLPEQAKVPCAGIVILNSDITNAERDAIITGSGNAVNRHFKSVNASAVFILSTDGMAALAANPRVAKIIPDRVIHANDKGGNKGNPSFHV